MKKRNVKREIELVNADPKKVAKNRDRARARYEAGRQGLNIKGQDVAHKHALAKGGKNEDGVFVESAHDNRAYERDGKRKPQSAVDKHYAGKKVVVPQRVYNTKYGKADPNAKRKSRGS